MNTSIKKNTFNNVHFLNKTGVDPDPKCNNDNIQIYTSDDYFKICKQNFDVIFIDGMHCGPRSPQD